MTIKLEIQNMKCMGCVNQVKALIESIDGVTEAHVDLEQASAEVTGTVEPGLLEQAITNAGYPATCAR